MPAKFGVPQGSVLGLLLFSTFCNDLPDVVDDEDENIKMYVDDTTLYVFARTPDDVAKMLNKTLKRLYEWCCVNGLSPHLDKIEYMLLGQGKFIGPLQVIRFGNYSIKHVLVSRCLGLEIDHQLNWKYHVSVVIKAFTQKLNLLKLNL